MIFIFNNKNFSTTGYILGIIYSVFFNAINNGYSDDYLGAFFFSIPFILISALIGIVISKLRKDKLSGVYFLISCLILVSIQ